MGNQPTVWQPPKSPLMEGVWRVMHTQKGQIKSLHGHVDRAWTARREYYHEILGDMDVASAASQLSLAAKRKLTGYTHLSPAYTEDDLYQRMSRCLEDAIHFGVDEFRSCIDTTPDIGQRALKVALRLKKEYRGRINFKPLAYALFGFKDPKANPDRLHTFCEAAEMAEGVCGLPESDLGPGRVGPVEHIRTVLKTGIKLGIPVYIHGDQANDPLEGYTKMVVEAVKWLGVPDVKAKDKLDPDEPTVWVVHAISPAAYPWHEMMKVARGLKKFNIGVNCCPVSAISMRQYPCIEAPTHNSIAPGLWFLREGVRVVLSVDNIADVFQPEVNGDPEQQITQAASAWRFYYPDVLAKMAMARPLNETDIDKVHSFLEKECTANRMRAELGERLQREELSPWTLPSR